MKVTICELKTLGGNGVRSGVKPQMTPQESINRSSEPLEDVLCFIELHMVPECAIVINYP